MDLKIIGDNKESLENIINENFFDYIYEEYLKYFCTWKDEIEKLKKKREEIGLNLYDFKILYKIAQSQIKEFFLDYRNSQSYSFILKILQENDQINARLYSYNILSKD